MSFRDGDPICVFNGSVSGTQLAPTQMKVFDFSGKRYFQIESEPALQMSGHVVWHDDAILAWVSDSTNVNHFIGETLGPVWQRMLSKNFSSAHIVVTSSGLWPHPSNPANNRFLWLLTLIPSQPRIFMARTAEVNPAPPILWYGRMAPSRTYNAVTGEGRDLHVPHCFRHAYLQTPSHGLPSKFYKEVGARAQSARAGACEAGHGYTLLLQRAASRRIVNEKEVSAALRRKFGLPVVRVLHENKTAQKQMAMACGARVYVGVQGMGMEWAHFLNAGAGKGLVIELTWAGWPQYYTPLMRNSGLWAVDLIATRLNRATMPKYDDVQLDVSHIEDISMSSPYTLKHRQKASDAVHAVVAITEAQLAHGTVTAELSQTAAELKTGTKLRTLRPEVA